MLSIGVENHTGINNYPFNVLGQTRSGNASPTFYTHQQIICMLSKQTIKLYIGHSDSSQHTFQKNISANKSALKSEKINSLQNLCESLGNPKSDFAFYYTYTSSRSSELEEKNSRIMFSSKNILAIIAITCEYSTQERTKQNFTHWTESQTTVMSQTCIHSTSLTDNDKLWSVYKCDNNQHIRVL